MAEHVEVRFANGALALDRPQAFVNFIVLNLSFEIILGMPWLM